MKDDTKKRPCDECETRKYYAKFDLHIAGEDCPYYCQKYDEWKDEYKDGDGDG